MENIEDNVFEPPKDLTDISYSMGLKIMDILNIKDINRRKDKIIRLILGLDKKTCNLIPDDIKDSYFNLINMMLNQCIVDIEDVLVINDIEYNRIKLSRDSENSPNLEEYIDIDTIFKRSDKVLEAGMLLVSYIYGIPQDLVKEHISTGYLLAFYNYVIEDKMVINEEFPNIFIMSEEDEEEKVVPFGCMSETTAEVYGMYDTVFNLCGEDIIQIDTWYKKPVREFLVYVSWRIRKAQENKLNGGKR